MKEKEPPLALVKTWYELLIQENDEAAREHAGKMLMGAFGSQQAVADYLRKHKIIS
ncbi:hypothetical protein [Lacimicrobium alkaliphilum]|uniref:hypothetical protein n=1 Tax=Lacimicrobium alkaliphilum TaxID=1526571 RepID=UPI0012E37CAB|nr:hypothetical protein [Lacimicrobium alkaliphilum]